MRSPTNRQSEIVFPDGSSLRNPTEMQSLFVIEFTSGAGAIGNASEAARRAGYSEASAHEIGRQLLEKPHIRAAIEKANRDQLSGPASTKAIALLERVIDDEAQPIKVRVDAAKAILDRGGFSTPRAEGFGPGKNDSKPLSAMSQEELAAYVERVSLMLALASGQGPTLENADIASGPPLPSPARGATKIRAS